MGAWWVLPTTAMVWPSKLALTQRLRDADGADDAVDLWHQLGIDQAATVPDMNAAQVRALRRETLA